MKKPYMVQARTPTLLLALLTLFAATLPARAQNTNGLYSGTAQTLTYIQQQYVLAPLPQATITVCNYPATQPSPLLPCTNLALLYSGPTTSTPAASAFAADAQGNFSFWALPGYYTYTVTNILTNVTTGPYSVVISSGSSGGGGGATFPFPGLVFATNSIAGTIATSSQIATALNTSPSTLLAPTVLPVATNISKGIVQPDGTSITINPSTGVISSTPPSVSIPATALVLKGANLPNVAAAAFPGTDYVIPSGSILGSAGSLSAASTIPNGSLATTQTLGDNTTKIATDAFVIANATGGATTPATALILKGGGSANSVVAANPGTDYVLPSGTVSNLSGTPTLPNGTSATTQTPGDSSTKLATDAFVLANGGAGAIPATTSVLKGSGSLGSALAATPGTDYLLPSALPATSSLLKGSGSIGSVSTAIAGTDYLTPSGILAGTISSTSSAAIPAAFGVGVSAQNQLLTIDNARASFGYDNTNTNVLVQATTATGIGFAKNSSFGSGYVGLFDASGNFGVGTSNNNALSDAFHVTAAGAATAAGGITSTSDGVHAGLLALAGNTTAPAIPANNFAWLGFNSTSATAYGLQPSTTAPAANQVMAVGAPSSGVAPVTYISNATTVNGQTCTLGSTCTISAGSLPSSTAGQTYYSAGTTGTATSGVLVGPTSGALSGAGLGIGGVEIQAAPFFTDVYQPAGSVAFGASCASGTTASCTITGGAGLDPNGGVVWAGVADGSNDGEFIKYTGATSTTITGMTRGYWGSAAATHGNTVPIQLVTQAWVTSSTTAPYMLELANGAIVMYPQSTQTNNIGNGQQFITANAFVTGGQVWFSNKGGSKDYINFTGAAFNFSNDSGNYTLATGGNNLQYAITTQSITAASLTAITNAVTPIMLANGTTAAAGTGGVLHSDCKVIWSQATSGTVQLGVKASVAPTALWVLEQDSPGAYLAPVFTTITSTTTTATSGTMTPTAFGTTYASDIRLALNPGTSNNISVQLYALTSAGNALTIQPGTGCSGWN